MQPGESGAEPRPAEPGDLPPDLIASARGWHTIQMAVLGFIGICGVLRTAGSATPGAVQWLAAALAVAALITACLAIFAVGRVAYPVKDLAGPQKAAHAAAGLRTGIRLTVVALILSVIASLSGWWPKTTSTATVAVSDASGHTWCGPLADAPAGAISVRTAQGTITVPVQAIAHVAPVATCP